MTSRGWREKETRNLKKGYITTKKSKKQWHDIKTKDSIHNMNYEEDTNIGKPQQKHKLQTNAKWN